jgi:hypothetical protein
LVRLTDVTESSFWPTPQVSMIHAEKYTAETSYRHWQEGRQVHLSQVARDPRMWPTPGASKASNDTALTKSGDGRMKPNKLGWAVAKSLWPSPSARDWRSGKGRQENGHTPQLPEVVGGQLNPEWVELLMGFPPGYTEIED